MRTLTRRQEIHIYGWLDKRANVGSLFENYDPAFREIARDGDILVSGFNFGCGSS